MALLKKEEVVQVVLKKREKKKKKKEEENKTETKLNKNTRIKITNEVDIWVAYI